MAVHSMLLKYLDGLDASVDGRGFDAEHREGPPVRRECVQPGLYVAGMDTPIDMRKARTRKPHHA